MTGRAKQFTYQAKRLLETRRPPVIRVNCYVSPLLRGEFPSLYMHPTFQNQFPDTYTRSHTYAFFQSQSLSFFSFPFNRHAKKKKEKKRLARSNFNFFFTSYLRLISLIWNEPMSLNRFIAMSFTLARMPFTLFRDIYIYRIYTYIYIYRSVSRKTHPVAPAVHIAHIARILEAEKEGKGRVPVSRSVYPSKRKNIG